MKLLIPSYLFFLLLLAGCKKDIDLYNDIKGSWEPVSYRNMKTGEAYEKPSYVNGNAYLTFSSEYDPKRYTGSTSSNSISGNYELSAYDKITLKNKTSTYAMDNPWGMLLNELLAAENVNYKIMRKKLYFHYKNIQGEDMMATFEKKIKVE